MQKAKNYYQTVKSELSKVIFPTKEQVRTAFFSVLIVVTVISLFLALVDFTMGAILSSIIK